MLGHGFAPGDELLPDGVSDPGGCREDYVRLSQIWRSNARVAPRQAALRPVVFGSASGDYT